MRWVEEEAAISHARQLWGGVSIQTVVHYIIKPKSNYFPLSIPHNIPFPFDSGLSSPQAKHGPPPPTFTAAEQAILPQTPQLLPSNPAKHGIPKEVNRDDLVASMPCVALASKAVVELGKPSVEQVREKDLGRMYSCTFQPVDD